MTFAHRALAAGLIAAVGASALIAPLPARAGSKQTGQEATAASLAEAYLLYNYGRKQNSRNGAYALAGAAGTAYLWNKYSQQRGAEKRQERARTDYYRRRAAYYHKMAMRMHRRPRAAHR